MKNFYKILFFAALSVLVAGCGEKGPDGPDGIEVSGVTLSENSLSIIKGGMSRLSYTVEPEDAEVSSVLMSLLYRMSRIPGHALQGCRQGPRCTGHVGPELVEDLRPVPQVSYPFPVRGYGRLEACLPGG